MAIKWEQYDDGRVWFARIGKVLIVQICHREDGKYSAEVLDMCGEAIDGQYDITYGRIAQDIGIAMAHRILRDAMLFLEGKTAS